MPFQDCPVMTILSKKIMSHAFKKYHFTFYLNLEHFFNTLIRHSFAIHSLTNIPIKFNVYITEFKIRLINCIYEYFSDDLF